MTVTLKLTVALRRRILTRLADHVADAARRQDRRTGRFLADNGGWAVIQQDVIYPLALLLTTPGTRHHRSRRVLDMCERGGDALCKWQNPDGTFDFIKIDGSSWSPIYMPWSLYHWLEAYLLLRDLMPAARARRWGAALMLSCQGMARQLAAPKPHNIPLWQAAILARAAGAFDQPPWLDLARRQVAFTLSKQHPHGYFSEGKGPTTDYNLVYLHALGLYYASTSDRKVLTSIERCARFQAAFSYPDGTSIETVDGRVRYHPEPSAMGLPGLMLTDEGRALTRIKLRTLLRPGHLKLSPHAAAAYQYWHAGPEAPLLTHRPHARTVFHGKALLRRAGPWLACVSGYAPAPHQRAALTRRRWILTRANNFSLWHDKLGLIVGGGNSKLDPRFATFEVWVDGRCSLEPDAVSFRREGVKDVVRFVYGGVRCRLTLAPHGSGGLAFAFHATCRPGVFVRAGFTMPLRVGSTLFRHAGSTRRDVRRFTLDSMWETLIGFPSAHRDKARLVTGEGWRMRMPVGATLTYPVFLANPYALNNLAPDDQPLAAVSADLAAGPATFLIDVR